MIRYPLAEEYININKLENESAGSSDTFDVFHYQGPIVFYAIAAIIIIQLVQLFNYDVEQIYNLRTSLNSLFSIENPGLIDTHNSVNVLYLESVTSKAQFITWLQEVALTSFSSPSGISAGLFTKKTILLGEAVMIKYDTKNVSCTTQVPGNLTCIHVDYTDDTKRRNQSLVTAQLNDTNNVPYPWADFKTDEDLGIDYTVSGSTGTFNSGGYLYVLADRNSTRETILERIEAITSFVTDNTLAFNFIMSGYILDIDYFYSLHIFLERTPTGGFQPFGTSYQIFRPTLSWNYIFNLVGDVIVYVLTVIQVSVNIRAVDFSH